MVELTPGETEKLNPFGKKWGVLSFSNIDSTFDNEDTFVKHIEVWIGKLNNTFYVVSVETDVFKKKNYYFYEPTVRVFKNTDPTLTEEEIRDFASHLCYPNS